MTDKKYKDVTKSVSLRERIEIINEEKAVDHTPVCAHFGCNKVLTPQMMLYGNKCPDHSITKKPDPTLFLSF